MHFVAVRHASVFLKHSFCSSRDDQSARQEYTNTSLSLALTRSLFVAELRDVRPCRVDNCAAYHQACCLSCIPACCMPACLLLLVLHRYLVVGGGDKKVHIWDASSQQYIRSLSGTTGHKDIITGLAFREGTHDLFSCGADRAVKIWSLDNMAYVDTLFGHQSEVRPLHHSTVGSGEYGLGQGEAWLRLPSLCAVRAKWLIRPGLGQPVWPVKLQTTSTGNKQMTGAACSSCFLCDVHTAQSVHPQP